MVKEPKEHGYYLRREKSLSVLNEILMEKMNILRQSKGLDLSRRSVRIDEVMRLLNSAKKWDFEVSLGEAQNLMGQILDECVEGLEKCWWGEGRGNFRLRSANPLRATGRERQPRGGPFFHS